MLPSLLAGGYEFLVGREERRPRLPRLRARHRAPLPPARARVPTAAASSTSATARAFPSCIVLSDYAHLKRSGSIVAPLVKKYFGPGKRAPLDLAPYRHLFESDAVPVEFDPREGVGRALQDRLLASDETIPTFVDAPRRSTLCRLSASGYLLDVEAGDLITREGIGQREMFVILEGACEVDGRGRRVALLEKGDLFGEIAFFSEAGERTATVRALTDCRCSCCGRSSWTSWTATIPRPPTRSCSTSAASWPSGWRRWCGPGRRGSRRRGSDPPGMRRKPSTAARVPVPRLDDGVDARKIDEAVPSHGQVEHERGARALSAPVASLVALERPQEDGRRSGNAGARGRGLGARAAAPPATGVHSSAGSTSRSNSCVVSLTSTGPGHSACISVHRAGCRGRRRPRAGRRGGGRAAAGRGRSRWPASPSTPGRGGTRATVARVRLAATQK